LFALAGRSKYLGPSWAASFARWGYPPLAYAVVGLVEMAGGAALFVPRYRRAAAGVLGTVMVAAIVKTVWHGEPRFARTATVYLVIVAAIEATHRSDDGKHQAASQLARRSFSDRPVDSAAGRSRG
jgi:uncharacterized membrane protein YphA (DoxX/SURF4 family)